MIMKNIVVFILLSAFLLACGGRPSGENPDPDIVSNPSDTAKTALSPGLESDYNSSIQTPGEPETPEATDHSDEELPEELKAFIPAGFTMLGFEYGDLNKDESIQDAILVLKNQKEKELDEEGLEANRPLLILIRQPDGRLKKVASNDEIVLCYSCGGVLGDPFQGIAIKNGYFSVEHFGGSRFKWLNIITFKFDKDKNDWFLYKIGDESFDGFNPDSVTTTIKTIKDFGQIRFKDYAEGDLSQ